MSKPWYRPSCRASECNFGHFRHPADVLLTTRFGGPFPCCNGTVDEWAARYPDVVVRVDPLGDD